MAVACGAWPCPRTSPSTTRVTGPAGCGPPCSARTTASSRSPGSSSASRPRTSRDRRSSPPGSPGLVAGAMSMAVGEYISVSSQRDAEQADLRVEAEAIAENRRAEMHELAKIYEERGVEPGLARLVADQLMAHDAVGAHARDELGISEVIVARPLQAALTSVAAFTLGALVPVLAITLPPRASASGSPRRSRSWPCSASARSARNSVARRAAGPRCASSRSRCSSMLLTYGIGRARRRQRLATISRRAPTPRANARWHRRRSGACARSRAGRSVVRVEVPLGTLDAEEVAAVHVQCDRELALASSPRSG